VSDRIAQQVIKSYLEPRLESVFHEDSYGYRPLKSAHQAIKQVQENVRTYSWVVDMDIKSFFDEVDHELLMKALDRHVSEKWVNLYIRRWLESPVQTKDGALIQKQGKGTPQGGVISPLLANLYLHYVLDRWLELHYLTIAFVRYADDVVVHCQSEVQAKEVLQGIRARMQECHLSLNETKTKIVYCKDYRKKEKKGYGNKFDFLGFSFQPRMYRSVRESGKVFLGYGCEMSQKVITKVATEWKQRKWHLQGDLSLQDIATRINTQLRGLINYFGKINSIGLHKLIRQLHFQLAKWTMNKYNRFRGRYGKAFTWLKEIKNSYPTMFYHWTVYNWI